MKSPTPDLRKRLRNFSQNVLFDAKYAHVDRYHVVGSTGPGVAAGFALFEEIHQSLVYSILNGN